MEYFGGLQPRQEVKMPAQVSYVYPFDHEGVVRSNGYCDDNTRSVSTVHGCNTSLDHDQTLLSGRSIRTGVAVAGERFVRPRRHRTYNTLMSNVSTTYAP